MSIITRRALVATSAAFTAAVLLAGCSAAEAPEPEPGASEAIESIRLLTVPATDSMSVQFAAAEGIFEKHGLDVEIVAGQGGAAVAAALQAGEAELGIVDFVSLFSGAANGLPLSVVAPITLGGPESPGMFVMEDSGISSAADLESKNVGVISRGSIAELATVVALDEAGLSADDVNFVSVPAANLVSSLTSGQVDAVFLAQPSSFGAVAQGAELLFPAFAGATDDLPVAGIVASDSWILDHPGAIEKFRAALAEAVEVYNEDPDAAIQLLPTFTTVEEADLDRISLPIFVAEISDEEFQRVPDLMFKYGFLSAKLDARSVLAP